MTTKTDYLKPSPIPHQRIRNSAKTSRIGSLQRTSTRGKSSTKSDSKSNITPVDKVTDKEAEEELLFLTDISRPVTKEAAVETESITSEDLDKALEITPSEEPSPHEIRCEIYKRECARLRVVPLSLYVRTPVCSSLILRHCYIGDRGAKALAAPLLLDNNITYLDFTGNSIGPDGLEYLMEAFSETMSVTYLDLSDNKLGSEGAKVICDSMLRSCPFDSLVLSGNGFKDEDAICFAEVIEEVNTLRELVLSHNQFGDIGGPALGKAIGRNDRLESLDISWNHIRRRSATAFTKGIKKNVGLKKLNMSFNGLGIEGTFGLAEALRENRTLTELDISHNRISDMDAIVLGKSLSMNDTLKILRIGENSLTHNGAYHLLRSIDDPDSGNVLKVLDLQKTCVDEAFVQLMEDIKETRDINVIHGTMIKTGRPITRTGKRKSENKKTPDKSGNSDRKKKERGIDTSKKSR